MTENKRKKDHFYVYDRRKNVSTEVNYLSQHELAEGWQQNIPRRYFIEKKLVSYHHFSVSLAYLPDHLWPKLRRNRKTNQYETIKYGVARYTVTKTEQDDIIIRLYNEIHQYRPDINILQECINLLEQSQPRSWLVVRANNYIKTGLFMNRSTIISL